MHLYSILRFSKVSHVSNLTASSKQCCEVDITITIWEKRKLSHRASTLPTTTQKYRNGSRKKAFLFFLSFSFHHSTPLVSFLQETKRGLVLLIVIATSHMWLFKFNYNETKLKIQFLCHISFNLRDQQRYMASGSSIAQYRYWTLPSLQEGLLDSAEFLLYWEIRRIFAIEPFSLQLHWGRMYPAFPGDTEPAHFSGHLLHCLPIWSDYQNYRFLTH